MEPEWKSTNCLLCSQETGDGKATIIQHLAKHLEEISLSALPAGIDSNETSEIDSQGTSGELGL